MSGSTASRDVSDHNDRMSIEGSERCCALMVRPIPMGRRRYAVGSEGPPWNFRLARLPGALVSDEADFERWSRLTNKHRACLDPLLERKTSREIAPMIGLATPTVDQRLTQARSILGVDTPEDRKSVVSEKSVSVGVEIGGGRYIKKKTKHTHDN